MAMLGLNTRRCPITMILSLLLPPERKLCVGYPGQSIWRKFQTPFLFLIRFSCLSCRSGTGHDSCKVYATTGPGSVDKESLAERSCRIGYIFHACYMRLAWLG